MARSALRQLIGRQPEARALVSSIADAIGVAVAVEDPDGKLLHGEPLATTEATRFPVKLADASLGWVAGPDRARPVALLREHLLAQSAEQKALGAEVLHLYREINLIYSFSEKLAALLDLDRVAQLTLQEARHLIVATDGVIMLLDENSGELRNVAGSGDEMTRLTDTRFVIITHNPITMARMNRLYGVTMAERGVSQLVSVDLETASRIREAV